MTTPIQNLRSNVDSKRPTASGLAFGQIAINYNENDPAIYLRGDSDALLKIAPVYIASGAPNATPASGGTSGNSIGEQWLDISTSPATLKLWDGSNWLSPGATSIASGVIVDANISASAAIADTKLDTISTAGKVSNSATTATDANTASAIVARDASGDFAAGTITADLTGNADTATALSSSRTFAVSGDVTGTVSSDLTSGASIATSIASGVIVDADVNASAAIAGTKIDPDFGSQTIETTGVINAGSGTEAAPAVTVGTADNGLYSPGTDEVALATNGTGRLFIDSSGNIGVGIASPEALIHIQGTSSGSRLDCLRLTNNATAAGTETAIVFENTTGTFEHASIVAGRGGTGTLIFEVAEQERLRITSDGKVGVGTSSPSSYNAAADNLVIYENGNSGITIASSTTSAGSIFFADGTSGDAQYRGSIQYSHNDDKLYLGAAGGTSITIDSSNQVGIGTTSPLQPLHVSSGDNNDSGEISIAIGGTIANGRTALITKDTSTPYDLKIRSSQDASFDTAIAFETRTNSEAMRIDSSGRLLVGTSNSPTVGSAAQYARIAAQGNTFSTTGAGILSIQSGSAPASTGSDIGFITFSANDGSEFAWIRCELDGTAGSGDYPGALVFSTTADGNSSPTERMMLQSDGTLRTLMTGATGRFHLATTESASGSTILLNCVHSRTGIDTGGTASLRIYSNGDVENTNNSYGSLSDVKLKENIVNASSQWDDLKALKVRKFNFKEETGHQTHTQIGLVAQEVELVSPGLVRESPDRDKEGNDLGTVTKSVNYSVLYMKAVKALQEAMERIETLEAKVAALEAQ